MSSAAEKAVEDVITLLEPLEAQAVEAIAELVKQLLTHPDGAELMARRTAEALAAEAAIRN